MGAALDALLGDGGIDVVVSPLGRALQTAEIVIGQLKRPCLSWRTDARLREIGIGLWEGLTRGEVIARGVEIAADRQHDWFLDAPEAEGLDAFAARVGAFLAAHRFERPLLAVCHGQTGILLRGLYRGLSPRVALGLDQPQDAFYRLAAGTETRIATGAAPSGTAKDTADEVS
jgi:probable phosphoglycerate mutase